MKSAIIIHGAYGSPDENWFPWLKKELENIGYDVYVPKFPTPENQALEAWEKVLESISLDSDSILIGHSIGATFILSILEDLNSPIHVAFLVSGFLGRLGNPDFDDINSSFMKNNFDWEKIRANTQTVRVYHSDNDPYIPEERAYELASKLKVEPIIISGAGHFNAEAGYTRFPQLLDDIRNMNK